MENLDPPSPPPPNQGWENGAFLAFARFHPWFGGKGGLLFHFILSKIVAGYLRTCPAIRPFSPIRSLVASNLNVLKRSHHAYA